MVSNRGLTFNSTVHYRIRVKGFLDESWSERFLNMRISNQVLENLSPMSTLAGTVRDQAELAGVLNNLYEMHLPIFSVECLDKFDS